MKWKYIMDEQPKHGESIIHVDKPYEGHYPMGMRKYEQNCSFQDVLDFCKSRDFPYPDFWWICSKDFPFPDQPERSKREDYIEWIELKNQIPNENFQVLVWEGNSYSCGEILYKEKDKVVFLCGSICIEDPQYWAYLPGYPNVDAVL